jgi:hypothetical protein
MPKYFSMHSTLFTVQNMELSRYFTVSILGGACYNATFSDFCADGGQLNSENCFYGNLNRDECQDSGLTWTNPDEISTKSACEALPKGMAANWNQWDTCLTKEECLAGGQCDDWEFGGNDKDGGCVYVPQQPWRCNFGEEYFQNTRDGRCIDSRYTNSTTCLSQGGNYSIPIV